MWVATSWINEGTSHPQINDNTNNAHCDHCLNGQRATEDSPSKLQTTSEEISRVIKLYTLQWKAKTLRGENTGSHLLGRN